MLDGPVAIAACEALARRISGRLLPCGLDAAHLRCDELSFLAAAREAPARTALVADGRAWTYGDLAPDVTAACRRLGGQRRAVVVAEARRETIVTIWAALELGIPLVPLHPRLTDLERLKLAARLDEHPPSGGAAAIIFTSGTTGEPKGVVLRRENLIASAQASARNLGSGSDDVWLLCMPLGHVGGLSILFRSLAARGTVVLLPRFDPPAVLDAIRAHGVTVLSVVPAMLGALIEADRDRALRLPRAILVGGDAAPRALLEGCRAKGLHALVTYGLTEASSQVATQAPGDPIGQDEGAGRPLGGVEVRIVEGRVEIRGPTVMAGYLGQPPLAPGDWLDTGDTGSIDSSGRLHVSSRRADLIVTGGENVSPVEVERALESLPSIRAALVHGVPDDRWGELVAALLVPAGSPPCDSELWAQMASVLAPHKRPRLIRWLASLPVDTMGKLLRRGGHLGTTRG
ncbi:MAG: AMP-binding protein [Deltaproteobacteria bacterium]|nr:AMP-binding protein [Deltaproteobacteria bacterium]